MNVPEPVFFASNLDDSLDDGISNSTAEYLRQLTAKEAAAGREVRVMRLGRGFGLHRIPQLLRLRRDLRAALVDGSSVTIEGYKAGLFCLFVWRQIRQAHPNQLTFFIHDAGSTSHLRIAKFWAVRGNPRALHRLYRAGLDGLVEGLVLRGRPVAVVSEAEAAKINFTTRITVLPPSGMRNSATEQLGEPLTSDSDLVLYADLRVAHLRQSAVETMRTLARAAGTPADRLPYRLVVLGRRIVPRRLHKLANRAFAGGVLDLRYAPNLAQTLASAGAVWLPDLVGSGVKNRTLDALRHARIVIATDYALEGVATPLTSAEAAAATSDEATPATAAVTQYQSPAELLKVLS